ncbi:galactose oxidase (plasmid) [Leptospira interrogans]|uniref:Galactose oxidase, central domain protein n=2 Tax=Leptospira interrogans TaxID=173 RepID=A0A0F6H5W6_LEPIR|nr:kelch repeat-containing protein [Leptospira interrogans]EMF41435.1 galactose oxidase, central domain protein [Leptospira interrogans serovar Lora str. TE 1992]EJP18027.1 galactose oxidase, central domain protein [Leptospira interrogans str. FPW2026]EKO23615.1 galactose oxidase, central domain protein [Leptospira interrogans str. UI 12621]EKR24664.1 galactose oxidase, central domain protein [Leptospira interrogans serovar Bataviae str. L1111]EKR84923.1 galactose oxidase, central domain prote
MIFCNPQKNENVSDLLLSLRVLQELYPSGSNSGNASGGSITAPASGGNPEISVVACTTNLRQWTENELPGTGSMQTFTGLDNGIAVASGGWERLNGGSYLTKVTRFYNVVNGAIWAGPDLNTAKESAAAVPISASKVLITGGFDFMSNELNVAEIIDTSVPRRLNTNPMNTARGAHTLTVLADGRVLAVGGTYISGVNARAEIYNPTTGLWTQTGPPLSGRVYHTATLLNDGRVMIVGGMEPNETGIGATLIYNSQTDQWVNGPDLNERRESHTATLLQDGRLLVAGGGADGWEGGTRFHRLRNTLEIYDPNTNQWTLFTMPERRTEHGAFLEVDGSVVMIGGINAGTIPSTLRYTPNSDTWCRLPDVPSFGILSPRMLLFPTGGAGFVNGDFNISLR